MPTNLRRSLHFFAADLLHYAGALSVERSFRSDQRVCVLAFHRVLTKEEQIQSNALQGMVLKEVTFVSILEYLSHTFHVVSLDTFLDELGDTDQSRVRCLLTFDDGWRDVYTRAYPWLKKYQMPATVFLSTGLVDGKGPSWVEQVVREWRNPSRREQMQSRLRAVTRGRGNSANPERTIEYLKHMRGEERLRILERVLPLGENCSPGDEVDQMLSWDQIMDMSHEGIGFGGHTVSHPLLTYENDKTVEHELRTSKQALEQRLGRKVRGFAYPNGNWDDRVRRWVKRTGYECAFTTRPGWHRRDKDPYTVRRILLHEGNVVGRTGQFSPAMFSLTLAGWH